MARPIIHYAVTSHGLGHLTRTIAVLQSLKTLLPDADIHVSTTSNAGWLKQSLSFPVRWRTQSYEPGALQQNCFEVDIPGTLDAYADFLTQREERLAQERQFLETHEITAVISDAPALPIRAAWDLGIPAVGVCNFTWDWIIEPWCQPEHAQILETLRQDYGSGLCQLRLPFGPEGSSFPASEPAPLLSRQARSSATQVRQALRLSNEPIALVCPGGWSADDWPEIGANPGHFQLVTVGDLPIHSAAAIHKLPHALGSGLTFPDLVAAADVVLGKPGYGLASECLTLRTPFVMIDRPEFRETPVLMKDFLRSGHGARMSLDDFFSGNWAEPLDRAASAGSAWVEQHPAPAQHIAQRLIELCNLS